MVNLDFLKQIKEKKWSKLNPDVQLELLKDIEKSDYRIFPVNIHLKTKIGETEKITTTSWMLPFSTVRERMMKCPHCREFLIQTCTDEMRLAELYKSLTADEISKEITMESLKVYADMYDMINKEGENNGK